MQFVFQILEQQQQKLDNFEYIISDKKRERAIRVRRMEDRKWQKQFAEHIANKQIQIIWNQIIKAQHMNINHQQWARYSLQIFAMLTDVSIPLSTFVRRVHVFHVFQLILKIRIIQGYNIADLKKKLDYLLKIVDGMFWTISSNRNIDEEMHISFHKYIIKFIIFCTGTKPPLSQPQQKILQTIYTPPSTPPNPSTLTTFTSPNLLLWYQLFFHLRNTIDQLYLNKQKCVQYLNICRSHIITASQPVLKWIKMYNILIDTHRMERLFGDSFDIVERCLKTMVLVMVQIRQNYQPFLQVQGKSGYCVKMSEETKDNVFRIAVRFNVIGLAYALLDETCKIASSQLMNVAIQQILRAVVILQPKISEQKQLLPQLYERLLKYELQLEWMYHNLYQRKHSHTGTTSIKPTDSHLTVALLAQKLQNQYNASVIETYRNSKHNHSSNVNTYLSVIQGIIGKQMEMYRLKGGDGKLSDCVLMSNILFLAVWMQKERSVIFHQVMSKICDQKEIVKVYLSLLSEYHMNSQQLIQISVQSSLNLLEYYFHYPEHISTPSDLILIQQCINIVICLSANTSTNNRSAYICSFCSRVWKYRFCNICDQACTKFILPVHNQLDCVQFYEQLVTLVDYFRSFQICRVGLWAREELCQIIGEVG